MFRLALVSLALTAGSLQAQPGTHQVKLNGHTFTLPEGFTIEVAAGAAAGRSARSPPPSTSRAGSTSPTRPARTKRSRSR